MRFKAMTGVAQWTEHWTAKQGVTGSIPGWGTCMGGGLVPSGGRTRGNHTLVFLSFSLPFPL